MEVSRTLYEVAQGGSIVASFETREEADQYVTANTGCQVRVRAEKRLVAAAFAVMVNGAQVGDIHTDPGSAAKAAKAAGGMIQMVPTPDA